MPLYEYDCPECGVIEIMQKFSDQPAEFCPECDAKGKKSAIKKLLSATSFHLKGGGWYKTDYCGSGKSSSSSSSSSDTKTEKKDTALKTTGGCGSGCGCH